MRLAETLLPILGLGLIGIITFSSNAQSPSSSPLILRKSGRASDFYLGRPITHYNSYVKKKDATLYVSHDGDFTITIDSRGNIAEINVTGEAFFTERFIRVRHSTLRDVLQRYGKSQQVKVPEGKLVVEYDRIRFWFEQIPALPLTDAKFQEVLDTPVGGITIFNARLKLRSTPTTVSKAQLRAMLIKREFHDSENNPNGRGIGHQYMALNLGGNHVVLDKTTGLMWQQAGSSECVTLDILPADWPGGPKPLASSYIRQLNNSRFAGFSDWRLPTLEEAMSLAEPKNYGEPGQGWRHINPIFDREQWIVWTVDQNTRDLAWSAAWDRPQAFVHNRYRCKWVRAVRSNQ